MTTPTLAVLMTVFLQVFSPEPITQGIVDPPTSSASAATTAAEACVVCLYESENNVHFWFHGMNWCEEPNPSPDCDDCEPEGCAVDSAAGQCPNRDCGGATLAIVEEGWDKLGNRIAYADLNAVVALVRENPSLEFSPDFRGVLVRTCAGAISAYFELSPHVALALADN